LVVLAIRAGLLGEIDLGHRVDGTPYDHYLWPMRETYARFSGRAPSISDVRAELRTAYRFRYYFDPAEPYTPQLPQVTESRQQGDCKAKSLWLASEMGTRSARYVVGRARMDSRMSHAWLMWSNGGAWLLLDPTNSPDIIEAERVAGRKLFPKYSYVGSSAYYHPTYSQYFH
jgi:hypothetical protein